MVYIMKHMIKIKIKALTHKVITIATTVCEQTQSYNMYDITIIFQTRQNEEIYINGVDGGLRTEDKLLAMSS